MLVQQSANAWINDLYITVNKLVSKGWIDPKVESTLLRMREEKSARREKKMMMTSRQTPPVASVQTSPRQGAMAWTNGSPVQTQLKYGSRRSRPGSMGPRGPEQQ